MNNYHIPKFIQFNDSIINVAHIMQVHAVNRKIDGKQYYCIDIYFQTHCNSIHKYEDKHDSVVARNEAFKELQQKLV